MYRVKDGACVCDASTSVVGDLEILVSERRGQLQRSQKEALTSYKLFLKKSRHHITTTDNTTHSHTTPPKPGHSTLQTVIERYSPNSPPIFAQAPFKAVHVFNPPIPDPTSTGRRPHTHPLAACAATCRPPLLSTSRTRPRFRSCLSCQPSCQGPRVPPRSCSVAACSVQQPSKTTASLT